MSNATRPFKQSRPFEQRKRDADEIRKLHPNKVPMIIERYHGERHLPLIERRKYLVPDHVLIGELVKIVRLKWRVWKGQLKGMQQALYSTSRCHGVDKQKRLYFYNERLAAAIVATC